MASNGTFNGVDLGDYCSIFSDYGISPIIKKVVRANGIILLQSGGGQFTHTVKFWKEGFSNRAEVANYVKGLHVSFGTGKAELVINSVTYSDCICTGITQEDTDENWARLSATFIQSAF